MEEKEQKEKVTNSNKNSSNGAKQIAGAIVLAGIIIAGAILIKGNSQNNDTALKINIAPVGEQDRTLGNPKAKVAVVLYEDFQCPFCAAISGLEPNSPLIQYLKQKDPTWTPLMPGLQEYIAKGNVRFVYRDWAFLGPESIKAAEAARCAGDQGKFWEYHDYLYTHQNGENKGNFSNPRLESFAKELGLNTTSFNQCLEENKYTQAVEDSKSEGIKAGVNSTPKGFILIKGKVVATIDGAESFTTTKPKIDNALK